MADLDLTVKTRDEGFTKTFIFHLAAGDKLASKSQLTNIAQKTVPAGKRARVRVSFVVEFVDASGQLPPDKEL